MRMQDPGSDATGRRELAPGGVRARDAVSTYKNRLFRFAVGALAGLALLVPAARAQDDIRISLSEVSQAMRAKRPVMFVDARSSRSFRDSDEGIAGAVRATSADQVPRSFPRSGMIVAFCT